MNWSKTKCIVKDCANHKHEGLFVGDLCSPCHAYISEVKGGHSQAFRNAELQAATLKIQHGHLLEALKGLLMYPLGTFQVEAAKAAIAEVESEAAKTQEGWCSGCNPENCPGCGPAAKPQGQASL